MTTMRDRILRMRAELDALLAQLPEDKPEVAKAVPARYMSVPAFATFRGYSSRTVRDYCELGMPHSGSGKGRRVHVPDAIAWIENNGPKRARMARKEHAA